MKKILFALLTMIVVLTACTPSPTIPVKTVEQECTDAGYIPISTANQLVNLTNKLTDIVNLCAKAGNLSQEVPHIAYFVPPTPKN